MSNSPARLLNGCWLAHPTWFSSISDLFDAKDFDDPVDKKLWEVAAQAHREGVTPTPVDALGALVEVEGGGDAVRQLVSLRDLCESETRESFDRRVDAFIKESQTKRTKRIAQRIAGAAEEGIEADWAATFQAAGDKLRGLDKRKQHFTPLTFARFLEAADGKRRKTIIPTGYPGIDEHLLGLVEGEVTCFCARTNAGKSSFLANLAQNQFFARAALHPERLHEQHPDVDPYELRREPGHATFVDEKSGAKAGERAPCVLILSVEDTIDDYLGRFTCNLVNVDGRDFRLDPAQAVYGQGHGDTFNKLAEEFTRDHRLTIADYESEDGSEDKTIDQIEQTINGWIDLMVHLYSERGEERPPLLVLLDYFQKVELPEDEQGKATPEVKLLKKASKRLHDLAKRKKFALGLAVMLLRGPDAVAPDHNDARGGSDVIQDMETVISLWPFGPSELAAIGAAARQLGAGEEIDHDSFEKAAAPDDDVFAIGGGDDDEFNTGPAANLDVFTPKDLRRAASELIITGHKGRHGGAGWQVPLEFDRAKKRITSAHNPAKIYRHDVNIQSVLKEHRKLHGQERKR